MYVLTRGEDPLWRCPDLYFEVLAKCHHGLEWLQLNAAASTVGAVGLQLLGRDVRTGREHLFEDRG